MPIDRRLIERLHRQAGAARWGVSPDRFGRALEVSVAKAFTGRQADEREVERYLTSLHLADLALACACADGDDGAWEQFVLEQRPLLYRAADALDPTGGARDLADSLYADLFGLRDRDTERQSLFRYFHGRSSVTTWLRAVLAQRHVDRLRANRRMEPLPEEDSAAALPAPPQPLDPGRERRQRLLREALARAVAGLPPRDRLRLACYYAQALTLARTAQLLGEHEATASRRLARTRRAIRAEVESDLSGHAGLTADEIAQAFSAAADDAGDLDLGRLLETSAAAAPRKKSAPDRSR